MAPREGLTMRTIASGLLAAAAFALGGCATIFTGTTDTITFNANVPGVRLSIDGQYKGELPLTIPMSRNFVGGQQFIAKFEKEGYATQEFKLQREFNMVAILDITSIITSGGIDVLTGSLLRFSPTDYHVVMLEQGRSASSAEFRRVVELYRYALVNYRAVQKDLARGGGESLRAFAAAVCGGDRAAAEAVYAASLRDASLLAGSRTAQELVERVDRMLAEDGELRAHRI
jgi:hypothetical protein